jgi:flagellar L-ring protein precursor FlgH
MRMLIGACVFFSLVAAQSPVFAESLYREGSYRPLTADNKAYRIGDVLTVQVFENASAATSADTGTRRKNNLDAELARTGSKTLAAGLGVNGDFDGGGSTQRSNRVLITLSVSVRDVLANGDLLVGGEQLLVINEEQQKVVLQGRVRPQDISDGNVVLSTRLADASITYQGEGTLSERQQRAWWRKLLDWVGL